MASFVVETYVPLGNADRFAIDVDGIRAAAATVVTADGHVHHVRSYLVPSDEMGFHVVEAMNAEDVSRMAELAHIDVERIVEAVGVSPGDAGRDPTARAR